MSTKVLVTGAGGFIGKAVVGYLAGRPGYAGCVVCAGETCQSAGSCTIPAQMTGRTVWRDVLEGVEVVMHLAARVHVLSAGENKMLQEYRAVNVDACLNLARQAAAAGVKRFVFMSSIKVNGECSGAGRPFTAEDLPNPLDGYAISKYEAEQGLLALSRRTGMEVVIIRSPLVYGPGVKANFLRLLKALDRGVVLPLGSIDNKRSLVALDNLVDLLVLCLEHPAAANRIIMVSDGKDLSTTELLLCLGQALGTPARLLPVPQWLVENGLRIVVGGGLAQRLCGSLQIDMSGTRNLLDWNPPVSVDEGIRRTVAWYRGQDAGE